ncbi:hypothetical protein J1N35_024443 [Gossypium stocksii]|uniref:Aminotransferase-like plant mobile domain-containing protein n=1 Tax=Gossypium stocksii TaxID=47602 RepID=A0A9D3V4M6_9ROSI|nr:hypothetical protein J1N35_024443 [Gossypium stocksii]
MWRPEMHTCHLRCSECTITLEDMQLQLVLPVDGHVVTGSIHAANWRDVCDELLGRVPETIYGSQIEIELICNYILSPLKKKPCSTTSLIASQNKDAMISLNRLMLKG